MSPLLRGRGTGTVRYLHQQRKEMNAASKNTENSNLVRSHGAMVVAGLVVAILCYLTLVRDTNTASSSNQSHKRGVTTIQTVERGSTSIQWVGNFLRASHELY
jgi:hypothetical protein